MRVSILTPSYNYARFLGDCLSSVANQTYRDVEHIVVDGASTDESVEVLQHSTASVRWISEPDSGQSDALNKALAMSEGEIIGWLNADDAYADRRAIQMAVEAFRKYPGVGVIFGHSLLVNADNRVLQLMWAPKISPLLLSKLTLFTQPSVFIRRSVLPDLFVREDLRFVMDRDLWLRLRGRARFKRLDLAVAIDRHHAGRKVMSDDYIRERDAYSAAHGGVLPRPLEKSLKVATRLRGAISICGLAQHMQPAINLKFDSPIALLARQLCMPRDRMPMGLSVRAHTLPENL